MMEILFFLILGIATGTFGTLVGIGGGMILVPIFIMFLSPSIFKSASQVVGTSIFVVLTNALSGTIAFIRQNRVFFSAAIPFSIATLPGAWLGSYIADGFDHSALELGFGIFLMIMSIIMFWNSTHKPASTILTIPEGFTYNKPLGIICSLFVGFISSIFGVGGGVVHVPMMIYLLGFPVHIATATSSFILAVSSFMGVISHFMLDHILWGPAIALGIGASIGAQIGAKISKKTKSKVILLILSTAMFAVGIKLVVMS